MLNKETAVPSARHWNWSFLSHLFLELNRSSQQLHWRIEIRHGKIREVAQGDVEERCLPCTFPIRSRLHVSSTHGRGHRPHNSNSKRSHGHSLKGELSDDVAYVLYMPWTIRTTQFLWITQSVLLHIFGSTISRSHCKDLDVPLAGVLSSANKSKSGLSQVK